MTTPILLTQPFQCSLFQTHSQVSEFSVTLTISVGKTGGNNGLCHCNASMITATVVHNKFEVEYLWNSLFGQGSSLQKYNEFNGIGLILETPLILPAVFL